MKSIVISHCSNHPDNLGNDRHFNIFKKNKLKKTSSTKKCKS